MILLRLLVLVLTATLSTTALVLAVVMVLAAQWLLVATVVLLVMAVVSMILKGASWIGACCSRTGERDANAARRQATALTSRQPWCPISGTKATSSSSSRS